MTAQRVALVRATRSVMRANAPDWALTRARIVADRVVPARRARAAQWRRIDAALLPAADTVQAGPFAGMRLGRTATGSHVPKRLGTYEQELHPWVERLVAAGYRRVIDVGCGEGFYVVGLALRLPAAQVHGFDISTVALQQCRAAAEVNGVSDRVQLDGECTPGRLAELAGPGCLVVVDAEGAEDALIAGPAVPALRDTDLLVELHDFASPGVEERLTERLRHTHDLTFVDLAPREASGQPLLTRLSAADRARALDESRVPGQRWLVGVSRTGALRTRESAQAQEPSG